MSEKVLRRAIEAARTDGVEAAERYIFDSLWCLLFKMNN
jgi:hypothetical protein